MIYAPLPPSPNEAKKIIHVSSQRLSSLKKSHKTSLLSSAGWIDEAARTKNMDISLCI